MKRPEFKRLLLDVQTGKRIDNLVQRISELPADVSADLFYKQVISDESKASRFETLKRESEIANY
jgi:hypothetical protein